VVKELAAKMGRVEAMVQTVGEHYLASGAEQAARREFDRTGINVAQVLAREAAGKTTGAREIFGVADRTGDGCRIVSGHESAGLAILPQRARGVTLTFSGEFRWHHELGEQVDLVVAYGEAAKSRRFLKLAVLPAKVVLFASEDGEWRTLTSYEYDSPLERGTAENPVWHPFKINFDGPSETLRFETTKGRWTKFTLNEYFSIPNTHCGIGCYDGVAHFRNLRVAD
jgi:hypothetical protein